MWRSVKDISGLLDDLILLTMEYVPFEGVLIREFQSSASNISAIMALPDGRVMYNEMDTPDISVWDPHTNIHTTAESPDNVNAIAAMSNHVAVSVGNSVTSWNTDTFMIIQSRHHEKELLGALKLSSNVAVLWDIDHLYFHNIRNMDLRMVVDVPRGIATVVMLPNDRSAVLTQSDIQIRHNYTHTPIKVIPVSKVTDLVVSERYLICGMGKTIHLYDVNSFTLKRKITTDPFRYLTVMGENRLVWVLDNDAIFVHDISSRKTAILEPIPPKKGEMMFDRLTVITTFQDTIATGYHSGIIRLWNVQTQQVQMELKAHNDGISHLLVISNHELLSIDTFGKFCLWS